MRSLDELTWNLNDRGERVSGRCTTTDCTWGHLGPEATVEYLFRNHACPTLRPGRFR